MSFYPSDARVPEELVCDEFVLRPLTPAHAELDYEALMSSREFLRRWSQTDWPADDFTLEENRRDLVRHEDDHRQRRAFTYTVLDRSEKSCLGCVYIVPTARCLNAAEATAKDLESLAEYDGLVQFWLREECVARDLDRSLLVRLIDWFERDWALTRACFGTRVEDARQVKLFEESELGLRYRLSFLGLSEEFLVFCPAAAT